MIQHEGASCRPPNRAKLTQRRATFEYTFPTIAFSDGGTMRDRARVTVLLFLCLGLLCCGSTVFAADSAKPAASPAATPSASPAVTYSISSGSCRRPASNATPPVDLFPSWVIARNAYPSRKPEVQILCPSCGDIFPGLHGQETATCRSCGTEFNPHGRAKGAKATCGHCGHKFMILDAVASTDVRPPVQALRQTRAHARRGQGISTRHTRRPGGIPGVLGKTPGGSRARSGPAAQARVERPQHRTGHELCLHGLA